MKLIWRYLPALYILFLVACSSPKKSEEKADVRDAAAKKNHTFNRHRPSIEECKALAQQIEKAMLTELPQGIPEWTDFERLFQIATEGLELNPKIKTINYQGTKNVFKRGSPFHVAQRTMGEFGSFTCLKVYEKDSEHRLLFRLIPEQGGFLYQEYIVERSADDQCKVVDCHYLAMNEKASEMFRRLFVLTEPAAQKDLDGSPEEIRQTGDQVDEINSTRKEGNHRKVLELIDAASDVVKEIKFIQTIRLQSAVVLGDDAAVQAALKDYQAKFGKDNSVDFILIDHHYNQGKFDKVLKIIERLEAEFGDPYLNYYRSLCQLKLGEEERAQELADKLIQDFQFVPGAFAPRLEVALHQEDNEKIAEILKHLESSFDWDIDALLEEPIYEPFKKSSVYRDWQSSKK